MLLIHNTQSNIIINDFEDRKIQYAFHDIDGTHSLIREWPPVMSICLYDVIENGLSEDFDSVENAKRLISLAGKRELPETDAFCVPSTETYKIQEYHLPIYHYLCAKVEEEFFK